MPKINELFKQIGASVNNTGGSLSKFFSPSPVIAPQKVSAQGPQTYQLKDRGATITDSDIDAFRPLFYGEVSNRNFDKKMLEADVIFNTVLNRQKEYARKGQNKTISEILSMPNQYQAYGGPQYLEYQNPVLPFSVAKKKEVDKIVDSIKEKVKSGNYKDITQGSYYYTHKPNKSITYDNVKPLFAK